ncbi:MAG: T9SS type A sorting domain-containing protein, partial [Flavobacteriales bacterium]|nr:T9SS type A sorting domain-containing protein [Flavobacteriales bacterium]
EQEYTVNGGTNTKVHGFVRLNNDLYAALLRSSDGHPDGMVLLFLDGFGGVVSAYAQEHATEWTGYGELWATPGNDGVFVHAKGSSSSPPQTLTRIDTAGTILGAFPVDTVNSGWIMDMVFTDTSQVYMAYLSGVLHANDLWDAPLNCEAADQVTATPITVSASPTTTTQSVRIISRVAYTSTLTPISLTAMGKCLSTPVAERESGEMVLAPNPAFDRVRITWTEPEVHTVQLISPLGQLVRNVTLTGERAALDLDLSGFDAGWYRVRLIGDRTLEQATLVVGH